MDWGSIFFAYGYSVVPTPFVEKILHWITFAILSKVGSLNVWVYFWTFYSVLLIYISFLYQLYYYSLIVSIEINLVWILQRCSLFLKLVVTILVPLLFHTKFRVIVSIYTIYSGRIEWGCVEFINQLGEKRNNIESMNMIYLYIHLGLFLFCIFSIQILFIFCLLYNEALHAFRYY